MFAHLQQVEVFHLLFLRYFARASRPNSYALKGGANLRFFYKSPRYSEDMDIDITKLEVFKLKELVLKILGSRSFLTSLQAYQIASLIPPDMKVAKQTETVQRFKVHLITNSNEDIFTKIEFSRRGMKENARVEAVDENILNKYKQPPILIAHYPADQAFIQKVSALSQRTVTQARDIFDIFTLYPQIANDLPLIKPHFSGEILKKAQDALNSITYDNYSDVVVNYLSSEDREFFQRREIWEEIQSKVADIIKRCIY